MSEEGANCPICGKVMAIRGVVQGPPDFKLFTHDGRPACHGHYESAPKHDGKLDDVNSVSGYSVSHDTDGRFHIVRIQGTYNMGDDELSLHPGQALSLLAWLEQERTELQRLATAQEQGA